MSNHTKTYKRTDPGVPKWLHKIDPPKRKNTSRNTSRNTSPKCKKQKQKSKKEETKKRKFGGKRNTKNKKQGKKDTLYIVHNVESCFHCAAFMEKWNKQGLKQKIKKTFPKLQVKDYSVHEFLSKKQFQNKFPPIQGIPVFFGVGVSKKNDAVKEIRGNIDEETLKTFIKSFH